jgi:uncharacterized membrane protein YhaH (DUF805 family)
MTNDLYEVLGVPATASTAEIKSRYRYLCHAFHPDKFTADAHRQAAENDFKRINAAYEILSNPDQRQRYDSANSRSSNTRTSSPPTPPQYEYQAPPRQPPPRSSAGTASASSSHRYEQPPASSQVDRQNVSTTLFPFRIARLQFFLRCIAVLAVVGIANAIFGGSGAISVFGDFVCVVGGVLLFVFAVWGTYLPRMRDIGFHGFFCLLMFVPLMNVLLMLALLFMPSRSLSNDRNA